MPSSSTQICAAINVSPESFHPGSVAAGSDALTAAVQRAVADGAAMIDIGAMSTAPYKEAWIDEAEEVRRAQQALTTARAAAPHAVLSIDTQRAAVAKAAIERGATIINDISGLRADPAMAALAAASGARVILMANDSPDLEESGQSPVDVVCRVLLDAVDRALAAGLRRDQLIVDPGIGFFRKRSIPWHQWDCAILRDVSRIRALGFPVMVAASRKSFLGHILQQPNPADRLAGSLAVAALCHRERIDWLRVHDVAETRDVIATLDAIDQ